MDSKKLNEQGLEQVTGGHGLPSPVVGIPEENSLRIAKQLDEGTFDGSWQSMSGEQFLAWWRASNGR